jgi:hypothetical protein
MTKTYYFRISAENEYARNNSLNTLMDWSAEYGLVKEIKPNKDAYYKNGWHKWLAINPKKDIRDFRKDVVNKDLKLKKVRGDELKNFNLEEIVKRK